MGRKAKPKTMCKDPNGSRRHIPWSKREILTYNQCHDDPFVKCPHSNCTKPIHKSKNTSNHLRTRHNQSGNTYSIYELQETLEWTLITRQSRKRQKLLKNDKAAIAQQAKLSSFWFKRKIEYKVPEPVQAHLESQKKIESKEDEKEEILNESASTTTSMSTPISDKVHEQIPRKYRSAPHLNDAYKCHGAKFEFAEDSNLSLFKIKCRFCNIQITEQLDWNKRVDRKSARDHCRHHFTNNHAEHEMNRLRHETKSYSSMAMRARNAAKTLAQESIDLVMNGDGHSTFAERLERVEAQYDAEIGNKSHHKHTVKKVLKLLHSECIQTISKCVHFKYEQLGGHMAGFALSADKGKLDGAQCSYEYNRVKYLDENFLPMSTAIYVDPAFDSSGQHLVDNKQMVWDAMGMNKDTVSSQCMSMTCDRQYDAKRLKVCDGMQQKYNIHPLFCKQPDAGHLLCSIDKFSRQQCQKCNDSQLAVNSISQRYRNSTLEASKLKDKAPWFVTKHKGNSATKYANHSVQATDSVLRNAGLTLGLYEENLRDNAKGRTNQYLKGLTLCGGFQCHSRVTRDVTNILAKMLILPSQSDMPPLYRQVKDVQTVRDIVFYQIDEFQKHYNDIDDTTDTLIPRSLQKYFPSFKSVKFHQTHISIESDLRSNPCYEYIRSNQEEAEIDRVSDLMQYDCDYSILHRLRHKPKAKVPGKSVKKEHCQICHVGDTLTSLIQCSRCHCYYHFGHTACQFMPTGKDTNKTMIKEGVEYFKKRDKEWYCTHNGCYSNRKSKDEWNEKDLRVCRSISVSSCGVKGEYVDTNATKNIDEMDLLQRHKHEDITKAMKGSFKIIRIKNWSDFIHQMLIEVMGYLMTLIHGFNETYSIEPVLLMASPVFDDRIHIERIDAINKISDIECRRTAYEKYIKSFNSHRARTLFLKWNDAMKAYNLHFDLKVLMSGFKTFKKVLFSLHSSGELLRNLERTQKEYKDKHGLNVLPCNEIHRRFMSEPKIWKQLPEFMCVWTHFYIMGCSEGRVEGGVKKGNDNTRNRYRLGPGVFNMEHVSRDIYKARSHKQREKMREKVILQVIKTPNFIKKYLYVTDRVNPQHFPSKPVATRRRPAILAAPSIDIDSKLCEPEWMTGPVSAHNTAPPIPSTPIHSSSRNKIPAASPLPSPFARISRMSISNKSIPRYDPNHNNKRLDYDSDEDSDLEYVPLMDRAP